MLAGRFISFIYCIVRKKTLYTEELLLISPVEGGEDSGEEGRTILTRQTRAKSRKTSHNESKQVVQGIIRRRTSFRMGPVVKKKTEK